jgi:hypothetical protein
MNSRAFLLFRMFVELLISVALAAAAVDTERFQVSKSVWIDLPCRLLFALIAIGVFTHAVTLYKDSLAARG